MGTFMSENRDLIRNLYCLGSGDAEGKDAGRFFEDVATDRSLTWSLAFRQIKSRSADTRQPILGLSHEGSDIAFREN
jgi:hypothetical protein